MSNLVITNTDNTGNIFRTNSGYGTTNKTDDLFTISSNGVGTFNVPVYSAEFLVEPLCEDIRNISEKQFDKLVSAVKKELAYRNLKKIDEEN
jgi:hypothetical protein